ncbi:hypothetical protein ElyMa_002136400 [Elysia marginata]|uniref:Uncharacterized protein n=1 Tax=Elysia marginata TaxID=1093978 RepID=A0AAV4FKY9_9GAST|nr:hypothetical protein ElyMa_002136400 [Elysia marginata]
MYVQVSHPLGLIRASSSVKTRRSLSAGRRPHAHTGFLGKTRGSDVEYIINYDLQGQRSLIPHLGRCRVPIAIKNDPLQDGIISHHPPTMTGVKDELKVIGG